MKQKKIKKVPRFKSEDEEFEFWSTHSPLDYQDNWKPVEFDFSKLKPSTKTISLRLPLSMIEELKRIANKRDVPYQSLLKIFLAERLREETKAAL